MFKKKPFFIVFEGVEGCGKSYQSKKLFYKLKRYQNYEIDDIYDFLCIESIIKYQWSKK